MNPVPESPAYRWTTSFRLPTPSSPPKTCRRHWHGRRKKGAMRPAWPWRWPTSRRRCNGHFHALPTPSAPVPQGLTSTGARKAASKSDRSRAREFALQGLYQSLVGRNALSDVDAFTRNLAGFHKADSAHYDALLQGCIEGAIALDALISPLLDRPLAEISPIEHAVMWIARTSSKIVWTCPGGWCSTSASNLPRSLVAPTGTST